MIISHKHKFIFIKSRKTAGSSIQLALEKHCGPDDVVCTMGPHTHEELGTYTPRNEKGFEGHDTASMVRSKVGKEIWQNYFTFVFVRNPFDRAVSQFWFDFRGRKRTTQTFKQYLRASATSKLTKPYLGNWHFYTDKNNQIIVDFVGEYERLLYHYFTACNLIGIQPEILAYLKSNVRKDKHRSYRDYYGEQERNFISQNDGCRKEIDTFNYEF